MSGKIERILKNPDFLSGLKRIDAHERERVFCGHGVGHLLDTARIAYILDLEENREIDKEILYAAALLHDIGRYRQYEDGIPHEQASAELCAPILYDAGFDEKAVQAVRAAILAHRGRGASGEGGDLGELLFRADKLSRNCAFCKAQDACDRDKKNGELIL